MKVKCTRSINGRFKVGKVYSLSENGSITDEKMYEDNVYEPSEQELKWEQEELARKEQEQKEKRKAEDKEEVRRQIERVTRHGNAKVREGGELCSDWYCPSCHRWFRAWHESCHNGIVETSCAFCGEPLAHSYLLDEKN